MELWKRRQAVLAWEWDLEMDDQEEQTRPEFEAEVQTRRINPVTKFPEPYIPGWNKFGRVAFTNAFVAFLVSRDGLERFEIIKNSVAGGDIHSVRHYHVQDNTAELRLQVAELMSS